MNDNPFSLRAVLALVVFGALVFIALLWMIGTGMASGSANDGGSHAGGKGLSGFAALALFMEKRGYDVRRSKSEAALDDPGLLVLTPPHHADPDALRKIVDDRRRIGPTMVILPKWMATPLPAGSKGAQKGWVKLEGAQPPSWRGFYDQIDLGLSPAGNGKSAHWWGAGVSGPLPAPKSVQSGDGLGMVPLAASRADGRTLAAYHNDRGMYPALADLAGAAIDGVDEDLYPVVFVYEPDLLDNYGMANAANAKFAERLLRAASEDDAGDTIIFDLTLNGHARSANLLTLAFTPPFLAATLCLILAGIAAGWRALLRFGPARQPVRALAYGKTALVSNSAGLIRRARRLHLIAPPYVARSRARLVKVLGLPRSVDAAAMDTAIDRALAARLPDSPAFSELARRLAAARRPLDLLRAARALHALERTLLR